MKKTVTVIMADPAGNRTAFVEEPIDRAQFAPVGNVLLSDESLHAEQVGYLLPEHPEGTDGAMCMMGGEFCGNATRSFGYLLGKRMGKRPGDTVRVQVSGAADILTVTLEDDGASVSMPAPLSVDTVLSHPVVHLEGISHVLIEADQADPDTAGSILKHMKEETDVDAAGAIFLHKITPESDASFRIEMTPVVWVRETDSTIWESSCGSGSLASAVWAARDITDGTIQVSVHQPGGILRITLQKENGKIQEALLGGPVTLEDAVKRDVEVEG
ncbi:MAG: hypothetical protein J5935_01535 [Lachnospiraceae bacterium]|nr:hypothetical protein [Lachnospiraceae bacterium]